MPIHEPHMVIVNGNAIHPATVSQISRPTDEEITSVVARHYDVSVSEAHGWLADFDENEVIHRLVNSSKVD